MESAKGTRLNSWKEIAAYLKCAQRTAPRWEEDRGLPVHRIPGGQRNAVFAYTAEIDAWLTSRNNPALDSSATNSPPQPLQPVAPLGNAENIAPPHRVRSVRAFLPSLASNQLALL